MRLGYVQRLAFVVLLSMSMSCDTEDAYLILKRYSLLQHLPRGKGYRNSFSPAKRPIRGENL